MKCITFHYIRLWLGVNSLLTISHTNTADGWLDIGKGGKWQCFSELNSVDIIHAMQCNVSNVMWPMFYFHVFILICTHDSFSSNSCILPSSCYSRVLTHRIWLSFSLQKPRNMQGKPGDGDNNVMYVWSENKNKAGVTNPLFYTNDMEWLELTERKGWCDGIHLKLFFMTSSIRQSGWVRPGSPMRAHHHFTFKNILYASNSVFSILS